MLTQHNYQNVKAGWDSEVDCCDSSGSKDPECVECCYDTWQEELKDVNQEYSRVLEFAQQTGNRLNFVADRRSKLRTWLNEINDAQDLAVAICNQLEIISIQTSKIWYNACKASEAVQTLFCMIRDFFGQLDEIKMQYDDIQNCILNNTDPSLVKGQGILKALDDYKTSLDSLFKLRDELIKNIVAAVKVASLIRNSISTVECNDSYDPCDDSVKPCKDEVVGYGIKTVICEWYKAFACGTEEEDPCNVQNTPNPAQAKNTEQDDCENPDCELVPTFEFPICNTYYKTCVEKWLEADEKSYQQLSKDYQKANKQKEALTACKNGLIKAIKAVDPKTRCN